MMTAETIDQILANILTEISDLKQQAEVQNKRLNEQIAAHAATKRKLHELISNTGYSDYIYGDWA